MPDALTATRALSPGRRARVAFLPERFGMNLSPCASIRIHPYFEALRLRGELEYRVLLPEEVERYQPDLIAWHRISLPNLDQLRTLKEVAQKSRAKLLYDLDDNLLDMADHSEGEAYGLMQLAVAGSLKLADEVWCSTPALAARVKSAASGNVYSLANALDPQVWRFVESPDARPEGAALRLLYMGTRTHEHDFAFLAGVMERLQQTHPGQFSLTVIGIRPHDRADIPWLQVRSAPNFIGASYPGFVHWLQQQRGFDLGVAPLLESDFNSCKSHIKVLDYAAMGLASLASAVPAYAHALGNGHGCMLAPNTIDAWCHALVGLRDAPEARRRLALEAGALVGAMPFETALEDRQARVRSLLSD